MGARPRGGRRQSIGSDRRLGKLGGLKELTLITHLGLGDLILQSGLAVHLAKEYDKVYYPCRKRDLNSVRSFFLLQPKIVVVPIDTDSPHPDQRFLVGQEALMLGFYSPDPMDRAISFAENFYRQAGVSYDVRWDECPIQEVVDTFYRLHWMVTPWADSFIHDDPDRSFSINLNLVSTSQLSRTLEGPSSILAYSHWLATAKQIHVIDGPFLHLAESIATRGELFYHKYARPLSARWSDLDCPTRKKWNVLT